MPNAALRRDVMRAKLERSETGTRCGIALKRFVMHIPTYHLKIHLWHPTQENDFAI